MTTTKRGIIASSLNRGLSAPMPDKKSSVERILETTQGQIPRQLFVLAGPSGVGKYTITRRLLENHPAMHRVTTFTTRPPRPDEVEGDQYHFISVEEFKRKSEAGELLEPAGQDVYGEGHLYSMPANLMTDVPEGKHLLLAEVDINGTFLLKRLHPDCVAIFVTASPAVLLERIKMRTDEHMDADNLAKRLNTAREHIQAASQFDYLVFNDGDLDGTIAALDAIIAAERMRVRPGVDLEAMLPDSAFDTLIENLT
jgi:guanylate kinase